MSPPIGLTNSVFFLIFIALSASFFGMFEIILPSGLANKVDQQADKGGYTGAFFMALAMAILSFSCTGPIVAGLLIKASQGQVLEPVIGMAGFSLIFALPFTLFAIFPAWLKRLPKSGAWLNSIKIFFAFIMLAFSIYFLGKIDQSYHLNILSRPVYLSLWIVIFALMGLYFLGKIRFEHDSESTGLKFPGLLLSIASFSFALVLFTGLFGAELKGLSTLLPPPRENHCCHCHHCRINHQIHFVAFPNIPIFLNFRSDSRDISPMMKPLPVHGSKTNRFLSILAAIPAPTARKCTVRSGLIRG